MSGRDKLPQSIASRVDYIERRVEDAHNKVIDVREEFIKADSAGTVRLDHIEARLKKQEQTSKTKEPQSTQDPLKAKMVYLFILLVTINVLFGEEAVIEFLKLIKGLL